jgi:tight adherence protein C
MEFMNALSGGYSSGLVVAVLALIFISVFFAVVGAAGVIGAPGNVKRRLAGAKPQREPTPTESLRQDEAEGRWNSLLKNLETRFKPGADANSASLKLRMIRAGYMNPKAVPIYYGARVVLCAAMPLAYLLQASLLAGGTEIGKIAAMAGGLGFTGLYLPNFWLSRRIASRQTAVTEGFPDALDMLVVCVEAGLGLDAAFTRVGAQIAKAHPIIATHFGLIALELRAGKSREEALRNLAERIGLQELKSFTTLLIQSDALGASIAQTLRVYSDEMRVKRVLRAEEKAHKLPVLLSLPLVACILPAMLTALLLPGVIRIVRQVLPAMSG